jgi:hypothetical protein
MQLEDGIIEELEDKEREIEELGQIVEEMRYENEQVKQRAEQLYQEKLQTLQRMRKAGLPDSDICAFLNISLQELEQMTNFSSNE